MNRINDISHKKLQVNVYKHKEMEIKAREIKEIRYKSEFLNLLQSTIHDWKTLPQNVISISSNDAFFSTVRLFCAFIFSRCSTREASYFNVCKVVNYCVCVDFRVHLLIK